VGDGVYRSLRTVLTPVVDRYFDLEATGEERLPAGPCILAANHSSLLDWVFLARFVSRPVRFVLSREFFDQWPFRSVYESLGVIPIRDGRFQPSAYRQLLATLAGGDIVGVFPEGWITRDGSLRPAQRGIIAFAARAGVPIVPVGVRGAFAAFPRHARFPRRHPVRVHFGEPFIVAPEVRNDRDTQRYLAEDLMARIGALCASADERGLGARQRVLDANLVHGIEVVGQAGGGEPRHARGLVR
jgi:1-acyl-sn-glycerol-3-phosphate acyltransferase